MFGPPLHQPQGGPMTAETRRDGFEVEEDPAYVALEL
jgi:hypothetical protein